MRNEVVLGIDSSTQSTKVVAVDLESGETLSTGRAPHTGLDTQNPLDWIAALQAAVHDSLRPEYDVRGLAVAAQQHGLVTIDASGKPVRDAPLWNNTDAADDAERLNEQADFTYLVGSRLVASFTIAKLAHMARAHPQDLARTASVALPHDWLNHYLTGKLATDRGDASGTGWWSPIDESMMPELIELAVGPVRAEKLHFPGPGRADDLAGSLRARPAAQLELRPGIPVAIGTGDNMGAALGTGARRGEIVVSLGTSGTAYGVSDQPVADSSGVVAGFADATGRFLPLVCMLNCTKVVDSIAAMFGVDTVKALDMAARQEPGADGLLLFPYLGGERTPNLPHARGEIHGLTYANVQPERFVRAAVDGVAAGLAYCVEALAAVGMTAPVIVLVGGGSQHPAWQQAIADATGLPVKVRGGVEHVARGAAIQAAAAVRPESVQELSERWRPPVLAEVLPRPDYRDAFQIDRRRALSDAQSTFPNPDC